MMIFRISAYVFLSKMTRSAVRFTFALLPARIHTLPSMGADPFQGRHFPTIVRISERTGQLGTKGSLDLGERLGHGSRFLC
jgi:hypothetical protein